MKHLIAAIALLLQATLAFAADGAKFRAIGFSADERYFAFEQYGVQDGSGFAYTDIFILDITADSWVKGTPIRALVEDEDGDVKKIRAIAKTKAATVLAETIIAVDAELLAANPFSEVVADRSTVTFHDHFNNAMGMFGTAENQCSWQLKITPVKVAGREACEADMEIVGFSLDLKNNKTGTNTNLHLDKELPKSRFCALGYDIEAVVQPVGGSTTGQAIAIIGVHSRGFEGADRRFIALPFHLN
jgi:predicted secreted protein